MEQVTLKYTKAGVPTTKTLNVKAVMGVDSPEDIELFPGDQHDMLDGAVEDDIVAFRRRVMIDFGVVDALSDQLAILDFVLDKNRKITFGAYSDLPVALGDPKGYAAKWLDGFKSSKKFVLTLRQATVQESWT